MHNAIAIILAAMAAVASVPAQDGDEEVVIADTVDFGFPVAVYVDASRRLRVAMQEAVAHAVTSGTLECTHSKCSWAVHADRLRYFSGINGAGASVRSGLACPNDWGIPKQRFYKMYALEHMVGCLELNWDDDLRKYEVFEAPNDA